METNSPPTISSRALPSAESATFLESSFFSRNGAQAALPSPANPVRYEHLGLIVKYGRAPEVTVAEGQLLWAVRRTLPMVPVPEVYGWAHDKGQVFIYMELIKGVTLEQRWGSLGPAERVAICDFFLGHINREPLGDVIFTNARLPPTGPFNSVAQLHDWLTMAIKTRIRPLWSGKELSEIPDPYRSMLPDDAKVVFTHSDLHPSNIMVSETSNKIIAVIDWRQSGWYPDYWEFCKAEYTAEVYGEWMNTYILIFLKEPECLDAWEFYPRFFGH
ncbi:hypothetical protein A7D00_4044 [Trichophyton violaceum]|uniref:Aminoglycoside phosphotransferase domain-containing protein n=1 Tax=Trichophyton violaceum TaxID=34388 RepID=A0A178FHE1_TRIVO|nr:hypothetical protein A7D00_4044 [Trichophyton violaceum]